MAKENETILNDRPNKSDIDEDQEEELESKESSAYEPLKSEFKFLTKQPISPLEGSAKKGTYNPMYRYQCPPPQSGCYYQPAYYPPSGGQTTQPNYYQTQPQHSSSNTRDGCWGCIQGILACTLCLACCEICCCCCECID